MSMGAEKARRRYHSSAEWYTPPDLLAKIRTFYGGKYFDPCPASYGHVRESGLLIPWSGKDYVNPPYGAMLKPWIRKAMTEPVIELILLVSAYTETQWFQPLYSCDLCFIAGRVKFYRPGGLPGKSPFGSVLAYRGKRHKAFADAFADLGPILRTYRPRREQQALLLEVAI